jgi:SAM-dependent methyltransferase
MSTDFKHQLKRIVRSLIPSRPSQSRKQSNAWLRRHTPMIEGRILSIGAGDDSDGELGKYRDYFSNCESYTTSEVTDEFSCDLVLDVRSMPQIEDSSYDCIYCSGVLEHVDDFHSALAEITRILKPGGILLLGLPFRQALHMPPYDFWRFTEYGIKYLLAKNYKIEEIEAIDNSKKGFPAAYWTKAVKIYDRQPQD